MKKDLLKEEYEQFLLKDKKTLKVRGGVGNHGFTTRTRITAPLQTNGEYDTISWPDQE